MLAAGKFVCDCFVKGIPEQIVKIIRLVYNGIRIGVPIILILVGMFDMGKAITMQKEDDIKKAQQLLARKAVAAALVFLIISVVGLIITAVDKTATDEMGCVNCILFGDLETTKTSTKPSTPSFTQVSSINFTSSVVELKVGETKEVYLIINPNNATNKSITFLSYADNVASFKEEQTSNGVKVTIKGEGLGTGSYTAVSTSNQSLKASLTIRVSNEPILTVNKDVVYVAKGKSEKLTASLSGTSWTSNSPSVASVDSSGKVTAKGIGSTTITATYGRQTATAVVNVIELADDINPKIIRAGDSGQFKVNLKADNPNAYVITYDTFSMDQTICSDCITVGKNDGGYKAQKEGKAKVSVTVSTADGKVITSKSYNVDVKAGRTNQSNMKFSTRIAYAFVDSQVPISISNVPNKATCTGLELLDSKDKVIANRKTDSMWIGISNYDNDSKTCNLTFYHNKPNKSNEVRIRINGSVLTMDPYTIYPVPFASKYVYVLEGKTSIIQCKDCEIKKDSDRQLTITVKSGTTKYNYIASLTNAGSENLAFNDNLKNIEVLGKKEGIANITIKNTNAYNGVIPSDDAVLASVFKDKICFDDSSSKNLYQLADSSVHVRSNKSAIYVAFVGSMTIDGTVSLTIANDELARLGISTKDKSSLHCNNFTLGTMIKYKDEFYLLRKNLERTKETGQSVTANSVNLTCEFAWSWGELMGGSKCDSANSNKQFYQDTWHVSYIKN